MAYDNNGARIGAAGHFASRITAALITTGHISMDQAADTFADYTFKCLDVLNGMEGAPAVPATAQAAVMTALQEELGANVVAEVTSGGVTVLNKEGAFGPFPDWAITQFKAAGVTKVFDNRATKTGNQPWFKTPKDAEKYGEPSDKAFWPPR